MKFAAGVVVALACLGVLASEPAQRTLTFEERVAARKAIEQAYWNHRIWPKENHGPKPPLSAAMPDSAIRTKVEDDLRMSSLLDSFWHRPITAEQLQAEIARMARETKAPGTLGEIFAALHNDPFLIAECLARSTLARRLVETAFAGDARIHGAQRSALALKLKDVNDRKAFSRVDGDHGESTYVVDDGAAVNSAPPDPSDRAIRLTREEWNRELDRLAADFGVSPAEVLSAVPVGGVSGLLDRGDRFVALAVEAKNATRMTVASVSWAKRAYREWSHDAAGASALDTNAITPPAEGYSTPTLTLGGCTDDTWTPTGSGANAPEARFLHTAVWTGSELIVWGGEGALNTGGRYDPSTDTWAASSLTTGTGANVPDARYGHSAIWTGSEMIVWGGYAFNNVNSGGRYNPATDTWAASSLTLGTGANVASARSFHTAVWTGSEMIVWGGGTGVDVNTGGRYNPSTDMWAASSLTLGTGDNVPSARTGHTAIWADSEMIIWGGYHNDNGSQEYLNTGGRYEPSTDSWTASSLTTGTGANVPAVRGWHTAAWTGSAMIVWGGQSSLAPYYLSTGGRYDPSTDSWISSSLTTGSGPNVPRARVGHTSVWTGSEMIVWGGHNGGNLATGGRYSPSTDSWALSTLTTGSGLNVPEARLGNTAVWSGSSDHTMIVWGGAIGPDLLNTGDLYCAVCTPVTWYLDSDGDGHGTTAVTQRSCAQPPGYVPIGNDCEDSNPAVHPAAPEVCNGIDDDCDTVRDNGGDALCADGNACTADVCDPASGCSAIRASANLDAGLGFSEHRVDGRDLVVLADAWNSCLGDADGRYTVVADLDPILTPRGACINEDDFHQFMSAFGHTCP